MSLKVTKDITGAVIKALKDMAAKQVLIGIPADAKPREAGDPVTNAQLGYIHEFGSPAQNIPSRPFLIPGVKAAGEDCAEVLKRAGNQALSGNATAMEKGLNQAGLLAQASVRRTMKEGKRYKPLAISTLEARARRGRTGAAKEFQSRAAGNRPNPQNARPLLDTDQMINSITYVVKDR